MSGSHMELDHDAAVRAAAGLTDVGGTVDAAAQTLAGTVSALRWGHDAVGAALANRYDAVRQSVADALPAVAASLRQLDITVQAGAATLTAEDARNAHAVQRPAERSV